MVEKTPQIVIDGLTRALAEPRGQLLFGSRAANGLFTATVPGKKAAQHCKEAGYLHSVREERKGKTIREICAITEKGIQFLLEQVSPKQVIEGFIGAIEARGQQLAQLLDAAHACQAALESLKSHVTEILPRLTESRALFPVAASNGSASLELKQHDRTPESDSADSWISEILTYLDHWQSEHPSEDCPIPQLYRQARTSSDQLSIGEFHDALRRLHEQQQLYLHPWTGPLYEIPEPTAAMLIGHAVVYYASRR